MRMPSATADVSPSWHVVPVLASVTTLLAFLPLSCPPPLTRLLETGSKQPILMPHQMLDAFIQIGEATGNPEIAWTPFANLLRTAVEAVVASPSITMVSGVGVVVVRG